MGKELAVLSCGSAGRVGEGDAVCAWGDRSVAGRRCCPGVACSLAGDVGH